MIRIDRIQARMDELGLNPYAAAKKAGLGPDYVRDLLRGKVKQPSASRLRALAVALQCSPDFLIGELDDLGDAPTTWDAGGPAPAKLSVEYLIKEGFFDDKSAFRPPVDKSYWVISSIQDGDEWLERVESLTNPKPVMAVGTLVHVVAPAHYYPGLSNLFVVEIERDDGKLHSRTLRWVVNPGSDYRFKGHPFDGELTWEDMVAGSHPAYGKIVGAVIRAYFFLDQGITLDFIFGTHPESD